MWKSLIRLGASALAVALATSAASAADCNWRPERAVTFIVPWAAGGGTDATSRMISTLLERSWNVPINVVNRTGGNGVTGHTAIVNAAPDGYTIGAATADINTMHWAGMTDLTYEDVTPLSLIDFSPSGVLVRHDSPYQTLGDLLAKAKAEPGTLTGSGSAQGGIWHLALAGLLNSEGLPGDAIRWIPSQGGAAALQELVSGGVDVAVPSLSESLTLIKAGEIRAIAYMAAERMPNMPDVPTTKELLPGGWTAAAWAMVAAPKDLPEEIACSYEKAFFELQESQEWKDFKAARGGAVVNLRRDELAKMVRENNDALGAAIKAAGLAK